MKKPCDRKNRPYHMQKSHILIKNFHIEIRSYNSIKYSHVIRQIYAVNKPPIEQFR